jgi:hypothetical protein
MKKAATLMILVILVFTPLFAMLALPNNSVMATEKEGIVQDNVPLNIFQEASDVQREIRVALYNETNSTAPSYSYSGAWTTNVTLIKNLLVSAGFSVTLLTAEDIDGTGILRTALFDVFVMVDNNPRESITREVLDFWRGGGGILSFDGAVSFLCYYGIMVPDSAGNHGHGVYWTYQSTINNTVVSRHPVSQQSMIGDKITDAFDWATFDWSSLQGFSYSSEYTKITITDTSNNWVNTLARDTVKGGRVVQTFGDTNPIAPGHGAMIIDAINWLCPKPKARVVFDYTHHPYYGIDAGDPDLGFSSQDRYALWRDALVNRSYTVDKLFKSPEGNLTAENLAPYDILVIAAPNWNFTSAEVAAVTNWVAGGGGLILLGEATSFSTENTNINYLLSGFDMRLSNMNYQVSTFVATDFEMHPTVEYVSSIYCQGGVYVNVTGDAYALWHDGSNIINAVQEYGQGRVFLAGDINFPGNHIDQEDDMQYAINLVNWLSTGAAPVLLYVDEPTSVNYYRTPVATALNELGINYYLTSYDVFLNISLCREEWYLVIIDNPWENIISYYQDFIDYIETGGRFLMSGYQVSNVQSDPLWALLGFQYAAAPLNQVPLHIWEAGASIFNKPHNYGMANFTPAYDYGDEGDLLSVFENATALAGFTTTAQPGNASIVMRNDARTLYNGYLIDEFWNDHDDSTYADNFELWMNEIALMLRPTIDSPTDVEYIEGTTGHNIVWHPTSYLPSEYIIERNSTPVAHNPWTGSAISINIDGLANGTYVFEITVSDRVGYTAVDEVILTVTEVPITTTTTTTGGGLPIDPTILIVIVAAAGVIVIIIIIIILKKRGT